MSPFPLASPPSPHRRRRVHRGGRPSLAQNRSHHLFSDLERHRRAIEATSGVLTGASPTGYLDDLREGLAGVTLVLDASALIAHVQRTDAHQRRAQELLSQEGTQGLAASTITLAEFLVLVSTGLTLPDCCVIAAAEQVGASVLTFDDRLAAAARSRGLAVHGA